MKSEWEETRMRYDCDMVEVADRGVVQLEVVI